MTTEITERQSFSYKLVRTITTMTEKYYVYSIVDKPEEAGEEIISEDTIDGTTIIVVRLKIYEAKSPAKSPFQEKSKHKDEL